VNILNTVDNNLINQINSKIERTKSINHFKRKSIGHYNDSLKNEEKEEKIVIQY